MHLAFSADCLHCRGSASDTPKISSGRPAGASRKSSRNNKARRSQKDTQTVITRREYWGMIGWYHLWNVNKAYLVGCLKYQQKISELVTRFSFLGIKLAKSSEKKGKGNHYQSYFFYFLRITSATVLVNVF